MDAASINLGTPNRVVPDISMLADPFTGFFQGETMYERERRACWTLAALPSRNPRMPSTAPSRTVAARAASRRSSPAWSPSSTPLASRPVNRCSGLPIPTLYKLAVGAPGTAAPIQDARRLSQPFALIDEELYAGDGIGFGAVCGINMAPVNGNDLNTGWILGADSKLMTMIGFDNVTGLGTPWLPGLVAVLAPGAK